MDAVNPSNNYRLFASSIAQLKPISEQATKVMQAHCRDMSVYAGILLREFKALVEILSKLSDQEFQLVYPEVYSAIERLTRWFDETSSINTIELYSALRHLKQKATTHIKTSKSKKGSAEKKSVLIAKKHLSDYLLNR